MQIRLDTVHLAELPRETQEGGAQTVLAAENVPLHSHRQAPGRTPLLGDEPHRDINLLKNSAT